MNTLHIFQILDEGTLTDIDIAINGVEAIKIFNEYAENYAGKKVYENLTKDMISYDDKLKAVNDYLDNNVVILWTQIPFIGDIQIKKTD